jgi:enoyl-CoA hydratase/carnithine racemase
VNGFTVVTYQKSESIGWVTLNRPDKLNVYNTQMRDELYQIMEAVRYDPEVEGVVLQGAGDRAFCAGADLTEFGTAPSPAIARKVRWQRDIWGLFLELKKPLVGALHGYVLGSGVEIAMLCDIRIASEDAVFGMPELSRGLIPAAGGTQTITRALGMGNALETLLTGRYLSAHEAHAAGLVNRVVSREQLLPETKEVMVKMLNLNPLIATHIKQAIVRGMDMPIEKALELETKLARMLISTKK